MRFAEKITLISVSKDHSTPFPKDKETPRYVFANKKSPTRAEYAANDSRGIEIRYMFEVREGEYKGEQLLEYSGERLDVYRTYEKGFVTEIYVASAKAGRSP